MNTKATMKHVNKPYNDFEPMISEHWIENHWRIFHEKANKKNTKQLCNFLFYDALWFCSLTIIM